MGSDQGSTGGQMPLFNDEQLLFTAGQAAQRLQIGRTTLYALIKAGRLHTVHIGRSCRLTRAELVRYVAQLDDEGEASAEISDAGGAQVIDLATARQPEPPGVA